MSGIGDMDRRQIQVIVERMGGTLLPNTSLHQYRMEVRSQTTGKLYVVSQRISNHRWECSCFGWVSHNHGRFDFRCKHLRVMVPALERVIHEALGGDR